MFIKSPSGITRFDAHEVTFQSGDIISPTSHRESSLSNRGDQKRQIEKKRLHRLYTQDLLELIILQHKISKIHR